MSSDNKKSRVPIGKGSRLVLGRQTGLQLGGSVV